MYEICFVAQYQCGSVESEFTRELEVIEQAETWIKAFAIITAEDDDQPIHLV